jgi:phosphoribosylformylglycinamidine synthase
MKNLTPADIESSIEEMSRRINKAQNSNAARRVQCGRRAGRLGKFIATVFRNPIIKEDILNLLYKRDGLMLGICNGFQALIKLGLVPYGEIRDMDSSCPTLTYNTIGRHVSTMVRTVVSSISFSLAVRIAGRRITYHTRIHGEGRFVCKR